MPSQSPAVVHDMKALAACMTQNETENRDAQRIIDEQADALGYTRHRVTELESEILSVGHQLERHRTNETWLETALHQSQVRDYSDTPVNFVAFDLSFAFCNCARSLLFGMHCVADIPMARSVRNRAGGQSVRCCEFCVPFTSHYHFPNVPRSGLAGTTLQYVDAVTQWRAAFAADDSRCCRQYE